MSATIQGATSNAIAICTVATLSYKWNLNEYKSVHCEQNKNGGIKKEESFFVTPHCRNVFVIVARCAIVAVDGIHKVCYTGPIVV